MTKEQFDFIRRISGYLTHFGLMSQDVADFIGCQFALESRYGTSVFAKKYHNFCGMKNPVKRMSLSLRAGNKSVEWAEYQNLEDCILDYCLLLSYRRLSYDDVHDLDRFKKCIGFYCPESSYIWRITAIYNQFINN